MFTVSTRPRAEMGDTRPGRTEAPPANVLLYAAPSHQNNRRIKGTHVLRDGKRGFPLPEFVLESWIEMGTFSVSGVVIRFSVVFWGWHGLQLSFLGKIVFRRERQAWKPPFKTQTRTGPPMF